MPRRNRRRQTKRRTYSTSPGDPSAPLSTDELAEALVARGAAPATILGREHRPEDRANHPETRSTP